MATRRGQALMELAVGMLALALVVSLLCGFAVYIARSLKAQNSLRTGIGTGGGANAKSDFVEIDDFSEKYAFGLPNLQIKEAVEMPSTAIVR